MSKTVVIPEPVAIEKPEPKKGLIALASRLRDENLDEIIEKGEPLSVLFETREGDVMHGHSAEFAEVCVTTDKALHGVFASVLPTHKENGILYGALLNDGKSK